MEKIINVVKDYLTRETNNALLITGQWGVGKTYFFNNTLSEKIKEINIKGKTNSNYTPIRVSLFGVTNIDDLERRIVAALFPLLNTLKKWGEKTLTFLSSIPKIKEYIPDKPINRLKNTDINSKVIISKANTLVICFDDLERISKSFAIENLIGYINNLSENYDFKVILIGNTDKIKSKIFKKIKEKLIGVEIEFDNDIKSIFDDIVKKKFHENKSNRNTYEKFLKDEKDFICSFFSKDYKNIRTLLIVLECYKHIYSAITENSESKSLEQYKDDLIKSTLLFTIAIAIEFKKGNLSKKDKEIMNDEIQTILNFTKNQEEDLFAEPQENESINPNILQKKYYEQNNYKYYETIFDYIVGIDTFIEKNFTTEVKRKYGISQKENLSECYKAFNDISTDVIFKISNQEYKKRLKNVLQYVDKGEYELDSYLGVYNHIIKFGDPLKIGEEKLKKRIIKGIKKGKNNLQYNQELTQMSQYLHFPNSMDEYAREILQFCLTINEEKKRETHKNESVALEKLLEANKFEEFKKVAIEKATVPIFAYIESKLIFDFYDKNIPLREDIASFIKERVITNAPLAILKLEKNFYIQLQQSIQKKASKLQSGPEWAVYNKFNELLQSITSKL